MHLSDIMIDNWVMEKTSEVIQQTDFATLRQWVLQMMPIQLVIKSIDQGLEQYLEADKQEVIERFTKQACDNQVRSDNQDCHRDAAELEEDGLYSQRLHNELLNNKQIQMSSESEVRRLLQQIMNIENQITTLGYRIQQAQNSPHHHNHDMSHVHNHVHNHGHNRLTVEVSVPSDDQVMILQQQKTSLSQEGGLLKNELNKIQTNIDNMIKRNKIIDDLLNIELPLKRKNRQIRAIERSNRAAARLVARLASDPQLAQLSHDNRSKLKTDIRAAHQQLQDTQAQLHRRAIDNSYRVYRQQLASMLANNSYLSHLQFQERNVLTEIMQVIEHYLQTKAEEGKARLAMNEKIKELKSHQNTQLEKQQRVEALLQLNPKLLINNEALIQQNVRLDLAVKARGIKRNRFLLTGFLMGLAAAALGVAPILMFMTGTLVSLMPLLFVPIGVVGLLSLSLLITALVLTIKNKRDEAIILVNKFQISRNEQKMSQQTQELIDLRQIQLPALLSTIEKTELDRRSIEGEITRLEQMGSFYLGKANEITLLPTLETIIPGVSDASMDRMQTPSNETMPQPSAPPLPDENPANFYH